MSIVDELMKIRDARLKEARRIMVAGAAQAPDGKLRTLCEDDLGRLEAIHDEIEDVHEIMLHYLYRNRPEMNGRGS